MHTDELNCLAGYLDLLCMTDACDDLGGCGV
jgi:hypothetical protein